MGTIITNQSELDAIELDFEGEIIITGGTVAAPIKLRKYYPNAGVITNGNAVISMNGVLRVGCHVIDKSEVERIGSELDKI